MKRYAIVGFGCAGYHAAKNLREGCVECEIDVYSNTADAPANPMLTTYYVAGKISRENMFPFGSKERIVKELGIRLHENCPVARIDPSELTITLEDGSREKFDDILIATGSHPAAPPIPGMPEKGIYVMRTPQDADALLSAIHEGIGSALVIGASWVGIKVVEALYAHHVPATLADMVPYIFPTASFPETAQRIQTYLERLGIGLMFGYGISSMEETEDGIISRFADGSSIKTSIVVLCMGMRSCVSCIEPGTLEMGRGIRVDRHMRTSASHLYAVGDCCETREIISGSYMCVNLWANSGLQGRIAARNILGYDDEFPGCLVHNITHFLDWDFIGLGDPKLAGEAVEFDGGENGSYVKAVISGGKLRCVNILGNYRASGSLKSWLLRQQERPGEPMPAAIRANLLREGISAEFISLIGGDSK